MKPELLEELLLKSGLNTLTLTQFNQVHTLCDLLIMQCAILADNNKLGVGYPTMGYAITNYYGLTR